MLNIKGLDLTNVVSFAETSVDFKPGVVYVRGLNLDSDLASPTGNGVGKSLLFSAIPNVWYSAAPLSIRKKSRGDMLTQKNSSIGLIYKQFDDGPEYEIIQARNKYQIFADGSDMKVDTIPDAEKLIAELFPISPVDFYSRIFVSTSKPYALRSDTDSNRLQHIIDIARLDQYSALHKYFSLMAGSIRDQEIRLSVLEQQLLQAKNNLKGTKETVSKEEYLDAKKNKDHIDEQLKATREKAFGLMTKQKTLERLLEIESRLDALRKKYSSSRAPADEIRYLKSLRKAAQQWSDYSSEQAYVERSERKLTKQLQGLEYPDGLSIGKARSSIEKLRNELRTVTYNLQKAEQLSEEYHSIKHKIAAVEKSRAELDVDTDGTDQELVASKIAECKVQLKLEALLKHSNSSHGKCPTCQSDIDFKAIEKLVASKKKELKKLTSLKHALALDDELKELKSKLKEFPSDALDAKALSKQARSLEVRVGKGEKILDSLRTKAAIEKQLGELEHPKKPELEQPDKSMDDIEQELELCHEIEKALDSKSSILDSGFESLRSAKKVRAALKELNAELDSVNSEQRKIERKLSTFQDVIQKYQQFSNTVKIYTAEIEKVTAEIEKLKPDVESKKIVVALTKAYGPKGLRSMAADSFCSLLQANLNHYRDLIFYEPFEFTVESSDTGVSIKVNRNNGKPDAVSDVRLMSGAEGECFNLLCAASLITLTPDSRKCNLLILDEPTSHLHPVSKELFTEKFVPFLRDLVPSVFIIDNTNDPVFKESAEWVIQKKHGKSSLIIQ
jgi:DNA repair exonuclease SbcCD ATPase subunit